ncbi:ABC transporter ATP-binding protein [Metabacillus sp. SLBN-84]
MLQVSDLSKTYKKKAALLPLSFQASPGECIALCGGNGAGKSTLLDMIAGLSAPSAGTIMLDDHALHKNRKDYLQELTYMPDDFLAQNYLKVEEFLQFYGALRKAPAKKISDVLIEIGLMDKRQTLVKELSKGMRQRLIFGQALLGGGKVLVMDEPTNGLDPYWIDRFIDTVKRLKKEGHIILFSTHMMDVAAELSDRIFFLDEGAVIQELHNTNENTEDFTLTLLRLHRKLGQKTI